MLMRLPPDSGQTLRSLIHARFPSRRDELGACPGTPTCRYGPVLFSRMRSSDTFANVRSSRSAVGDHARFRTGRTVSGQHAPLTRPFRQEPQVTHDALIKHVFATGAESPMTGPRSPPMRPRQRIAQSDLMSSRTIAISPTPSASTGTTSVCVPLSLSAVRGTRLTSASTPAPDWRRRPPRVLAGRTGTRR
jgi:hypothetical protein